MIAREITETFDRNKKGLETSFWSKVGNSHNWKHHR